MNEEYLSYTDYLKEIHFDKKLEALKEKFKDKKVILFGTGIFLDAILDNYKITDYLNVIGISDSRAESFDFNEYKGFNIYKPVALRALNFNVILDTNILFEKTNSFLRKGHYVKKSVVIENIIQIPILEHINNFVERQKAIFSYWTTSKNIFKTFAYSFTCTKDELVSKTNYIKKIKEIKKSDKPLKVAFICSDVTHTEFMGLYNLLYFDKSFKVFPIIVTPDELIDNQPINEEHMQRKVDYFGSFDTKVIDGIDRDTKEMTCIHAFKPDLIFYQKPIYIKDDFNPIKMSEQALTFTIEYDIRNADFTAIGSKYFRKQISNFWKVFLNNNEDKKLFEEYTNIEHKNITTVVTHNNINTNVLKYLKKILKRKN